MWRRRSTLLLVALLGVLLPVHGQAQWKIHDTGRPQPPVITPATPSTDEQAGLAPSDAIVLFDGKGLGEWRSETGEARWKATPNYFEIVARSGALWTRRSFGDCQLHLEWAAPEVVESEGQGRGNSGVYFLGRYEVQILDSYQNKTYPDGQAAALYGQYPPLVNASRPPGRWQSYDIVFRGPRFDAAGTLLRPAYVTVFHNGVLVQDRVEMTGPSDHQKRPAYQAHPEELPMMLQDHGDPVRFRNIWVRPLPPPQEKP